MIIRYRTTALGVRGMNECVGMGAGFGLFIHDQIGPLKN